MTIQEALKTHKFIHRPHWGAETCFCYHAAKTGPFKDLVDCDYFTVLEDGFLTFSTSSPDFYAEDLFANDYQIREVSDEELKAAIEKTKEVSDASCCGKGCCD